MFNIFTLIVFIDLSESSYLSSFSFISFSEVIQVFVRKQTNALEFGQFINELNFELFDSMKQQLLSTSVTYVDAEPNISRKSSLDVMKSPIEKLVHSFAILNKLSLTSGLARLFKMIELSE